MHHGNDPLKQYNEGFNDSIRDAPLEQNAGLQITNIVCRNVFDYSTGQEPIGDQPIPTWFDPNLYWYIDKNRIKSSKGILFCMHTLLFFFCFVLVFFFADKLWQYIVCFVYMFV